MQGVVTHDIKANLSECRRHSLILGTRFTNDFKKVWEIFGRKLGIVRLVYLLSINKQTIMLQTIDLIDVQVDFDVKEYPEFESSYISKAYVMDNDVLRELTDEEYDFCNDNMREFIYNISFSDFTGLL